MNKHQTSVLTEALADIGYGRVKRFVYKARWSVPGVEHFLYLHPWGTPQDFLAVYFGLRNPQADNFAVEFIKTYGDDVYQLMRYDPKASCLMKFSLGRVASWKPRSSLLSSELSGAELAIEVQKAIREQLFPTVSKIATLDQLLTYLVSDEQPRSWMYTNSALRAAIIIHLSRQLHLDEDGVRSVLQPRLRHIGTALSNKDDLILAERGVDEMLRLAYHT